MIALVLFSFICGNSSLSSVLGLTKTCSIKVEMSDYLYFHKAAFLIKPVYQLFVSSKYMLDLVVTIQIMLASKIGSEHSSSLLSGRVPKVSRVLPHKAKEWISICWSILQSRTGYTCWSLKTKRVFWGKFWCIGCMYADPKTFTEMSGHSIKVDFGIRSEQGNNIKVKNCKSWPCCGFSSIKLTRKAFAS